MNRICKILMYLSVVAGLCGAACSGEDSDIDDNARKTYYLVTHGPTTDAGFWGDVKGPATDLAESLGVELIPLHPDQETTGELLNSQMQQAVAAAPDGIIATIWGDGMPAVVQAANQAGIPVAAINVYPDATEYSMAGGGKAEFALYSGQNDATAAIDVANAIICEASGSAYVDGTCSDWSVADAYNTLSGVKAVCLVHQQSAGVFTRCSEFKSTLLELGLAESSYVDLSWDEGGGAAAGKDAIDSFFASDSAETYLIMANGNGGIEPYIAADVSTAGHFVGTFDTSDAICEALAASEVKFASAQGHKLQAEKALLYLHHLVTEGVLPAEGGSPDGSADLAWTISPDGYRWYKTGPQILKSCD